jgi:hypothetical protein
VAGGLVYGYTNRRREDGHVERVVLPIEADVVRRIFAMYAAGTGPRAIAAALAADGAPAPRPRRRGVAPSWSRAAVQEIVKRPLYTGEIVWGRRQKTDRGGQTRIRIPRSADALVRLHDEGLRIIPVDLWRAVQERRSTLAATKPAATWTRSAATSAPALLAGIAKCA